MAAGSVLRVQSVVAGYGEVLVLQGVDLEVSSGELVALIGANGAGKSTLLKTISGLVRTRSGSVLLGTDRLDQRSPAAIVRRGVAHVPERRQVFAEQSVLDNLILGAYAHQGRLDRQELDRRIEQAWRLFPDLRERRNVPAGALSGGQQQMLAIARGLMLRPRMLLLDEPSLGLAPLLVKEIFRVLSDLRQTGVGMLLVEQNARMSLAVADRGYVLERGRVVLDGNAQDLLRAPEVVDLYLGGKSAPAHDSHSVEAMSRRLADSLHD